MKYGKQILKLVTQATEYICVFLTKINITILDNMSIIAFYKKTVSFVSVSQHLQKLILFDEIQ